MQALISSTRLLTSAHQNPAGNLFYGFERKRNLMPKMPNAGEYHRHSMVVTGLDRIRIAHGAAGLDDCCDACSGGFIDVVPEGEESIGSQHAAAGPLRG